MDRAQVIADVTNILLGVLGLLLTWLGAVAKKWIEERLTSDRLLRVMSRLESAVETGVRNASQVLVPEIKKIAEDGRITKEEADKLRAFVKEATLDQLTKAEKQLVTEIFESDQLNRILERLTEAAVQRLKS